MNFCEKCDCLLCVKEILTAGKKRDLYYVCKDKNCDFKKKCNNFCIIKKEYRQKLNNRAYLNRHKVKDNTLPIKKSTCPKCNTTGINKYERRHFNNQFFINNICSCCYHNW